MNTSNLRLHVCAVVLVLGSSQVATAQDGVCSQVTYTTAGGTVTTYNVTQNSTGTGGWVSLPPIPMGSTGKFKGMFSPTTATVNLRLQQIDPFTQQPIGDPADDIPSTTVIFGIGYWTGTYRITNFSAGTVWRLMMVVTGGGGQPKTKVYDINIMNM